MKRLVGISAAVLVNALLLGGMVWSSLPPPLPNGEVRITDMSSGARILVASRSEQHR